MNTALIFSTLVMGFLGSWHCGVMCGPISCNFNKQSDFLLYHMGRLVSYLIIGSLLFYGVQYLLSTDSRNLKMIISLFFGLMLIYFGLQQWGLFSMRSSKSKRLGWLSKAHYNVLKTVSPLQKIPAALGLLTGLFPCAWLYSFLFLSSQVKSVHENLMIIFVFWLSSLPAFVVLTGFMRHLIQSSPFSYQKISGLVLIIAGVLSVLGHWAEIIFKEIL